MLDDDDLAQADEVITVPAGSAVGKYDDVFRSAVALNVKVPDLRRIGYTLTGIRVYPRSPAAAELLYRDSWNRAFTLYLRRSDGTAHFDQFERNGLRIACGRTKC